MHTGRKRRGGRDQEASNRKVQSQTQPDNQKQAEENRVAAVVHNMVITTATTTTITFGMKVKKGGK